MMANDIFGDILNVRKVGKSYWRYGLSRVLIHMRGLDNMMLIYIMKDTNTFCSEPERITRWAEMASRIVREMA